MQLIQNNHCLQNQLLWDTTIVYHFEVGNLNFRLCFKQPTNLPSLSLKNKCEKQLVYAGQMLRQLRTVTKQIALVFLQVKQVCSPPAKCRAGCYVLSGSCLLHQLLCPGCHFPVNDKAILNLPLKTLVPLNSLPGYNHICTPQNPN